MLLAIGLGLLGIVALGIKLAVLAVTVFITFNILMGIIGGLFEAFDNPDQIASVPVSEVVDQASNQQERQQLLQAVNNLANDKVPISRISSSTLAIPRNGGVISQEDLQKAQIIDAREGRSSECRKVKIFEAA